MPVPSTEWEDQRCAAIPLQQRCLMSQRFFGVKMRSGAPDVTFGEVTYLVSRTAECEHAKLRGTLSARGMPSPKCTRVWSCRGGEAACKVERGQCPAKSGFRISSETRTTSLHCKDENLSVFSLELFRLAVSNSCLQLFHNNSNN